MEQSYDQGSPANEETTEYNTSQYDQGNEETQQETTLGQESEIPVDSEVPQYGENQDMSDHTLDNTQGADNALNYETDVQNVEMEQNPEEPLLPEQSESL